MCDTSELNTSLIVPTHGIHWACTDVIVHIHGIHAWGHVPTSQLRRRHGEGGVARPWPAVSDRAVAHPPHAADDPPVACQ